MSILQLPAEQMTVPETGGALRSYRMFLRDVVLSCRIGVYDHEKLKPQRVRINVNLQIEPEARPRNDDIANVLSYDDILGGIKSLAGGTHINLVETLAETIADLCLADRRVLEVRVMIEKLDVEPNASVGVEIERRRPPSKGATPFALPPRSGSEPESGERA